MFVLFEEAGKFQAGRVLSQADASAQVELDSGKRLKVKAANILLRFEAPQPAALLTEATALAAAVEPEMAWEFAPEDEFTFTELAREYFSAQATPVEQAAMLLALHEAPHYFRRAGRGRFRKAAAEVVQQALAAIEKKKALALQVEQWAGELAAGTTPGPVRAQLFRILFQPDKNAPEYKAVVEAARATQMAPLALLRHAGAIASAYEFHWQRFLFEHFPRGTGFAPALEAPPVGEALPIAEGVRAFSVDDSETTEIDDALSVQGLGSGTVTVGIHIAAPGLAFAPGEPLDQVARQRLSTVYMPGHKITMLPDAVVQRYTLGAGEARPAVSLYVRFDEATLAVQASETRLERVPIVANLRHDLLDDAVTEAWLTDPEIRNQKPLQPAPDVGEQLSFLYRLARHLKAAREVVRGKPETFGRPDYSFKLANVEGDAPRGDEQVLITTRRRGSPLDLVVAEAMILANSTWGSWLATLGVPAIYRSQASLLPGVKVRMGTKALPHAGIGVASYAWSTSPLRRYTDLVNQWQIIAAARHGATAALAAPFKPRDAELFSIISAFDAAYGAYNAQQAAMERFWTLQYLRQNGIDALDATVIKDQLPGGAVLVRADTLPLVLQVAAGAGLARGEHLRVKLGAIDDIALDVSGTVLARLAPDGGAADAADEPEDAEDDAAAGPIAIAVDLDAAEGADGAAGVTVAASPQQPAPGAAAEPAAGA